MTDSSLKSISKKFNERFTSLSGNLNKIYLNPAHIWFGFWLSDETRHQTQRILNSNLLVLLLFFFFEFTVTSRCLICVFVYIYADSTVRYSRALMLSLRIERVRIPQGLWIAGLYICALCWSAKVKGIYVTSCSCAFLPACTYRYECASAYNCGGMWCHLTRERKMKDNRSMMFNNSLMAINNTYDYVFLCIVSRLVLNF